MSNDRNEIFGEDTSGDAILWCLSCERTYLYKEHRTMCIDLGEELLEICAYQDCTGDAVLDAKDWEWVREKHTDYPETPEKGKVYPLY